MRTKNNTDINPFLLSLSPIHNNLKKYIYKLKETILEKNFPADKLLDLLDSLIHMHCNRLMGINAELERKARCFSEFITKKIQYKETQ